MLTVLSRVKGDLAILRKHALPSLGEIETSAAKDDPFRARASKTDVAGAFVKLARLGARAALTCIKDGRSRSRSPGHYRSCAPCISFIARAGRGPAAPGRGGCVPAPRWPPAPGPDPQSPLSLGHASRLGGPEAGARRPPLCSLLRGIIPVVWGKFPASGETPRQERVKTH